MRGTGTPWEWAAFTIVVMVLVLAVVLHAGDVPIDPDRYRR